MSFTMNWLCARVRRLGPVVKLATVAGSVAVLLSACGGGSGNSPSSGNAAALQSSGGGPVVSGPGGTVTIRTVDDLDTFNPATSGAPNTALEAIELTYDRLLYLTPTGKLKPYLATSWTTTPNSVTLKIRKGATCSDGTPITPAVIADSLKYSLAKSTAGPYAQYVTGLGSLTSVTYNNPNDTVKIVLTKPYNALLQSLATPYSATIICPAGVRNPKSLSTAPAGSGPYVYDQSASQRGSSYVFNLRKNYDWGPAGWNAQKAGIPTKVVLKVVTDETTAANLFLTGGVNIAPATGINEPRVQGNHSAYTFMNQSLQAGSWGVLFNQGQGRVGADAAVRHAAYLALDASAMTKAAFSNLGVMFKTMLTPNMTCYDPALGNATPAYNLAQARQILERDGYKLSGGAMTRGGKPINLKLVMWNTTNQLGDYIQSQLRKIGINSTLENTDAPTWVNVLFTTKNWDLTVFAYYSAFTDPSIMPAQDATLSINDPTYFKLSTTAEQAPSNKCAAWDTALRRAVSNYDVKPVGVAKNMWFGKGWKFSAPFNVFIDPFTIEKTK